MKTLAIFRTAVALSLSLGTLVSMAQMPGRPLPPPPGTQFGGLNGGRMNDRHDNDRNDGRRDDRHDGFDGRMSGPFGFPGDPRREAARQEEIRKGKLVAENTCRTKAYTFEIGNCLNVVNNATFFDSSVLTIVCDNMISTSVRTCVEVVSNKRYASDEIFACQQRGLDQNKLQCLRNLGSAYTGPDFGGNQPAPYPGSPGLPLPPPNTQPYPYPQPPPPPPQDVEHTYYAGSAAGSEIAFGSTGLVGFGMEIRTIEVAQRGMELFGLRLLALDDSFYVQQIEAIYDNGSIVLLADNMTIQERRDRVIGLPQDARGQLRSLRVTGRQASAWATRAQLQVSGYGYVYNYQGQETYLGTTELTKNRTTKSFIISQNIYSIQSIVVTARDDMYTLEGITLITQTGERISVDLTLMGQNSRSISENQRLEIAMTGLARRAQLVREIQVTGTGGIIWGSKGRADVSIKY